jgi:dTDP-4-dehydrorhamnose reductase
VYGQSKLKGEAYIQSSGCRYVILRTSWVISATGKNFLKTIMRHALTKDRLQVVNDQIGAVTCAGLIAQVTDDLIRKDAVAQIDSGIYHLCSSGEGSWFDVAVYAIKRASERGVLLRCDASNVQPVSSDEYPTRAKRPSNSRLNTEKLQRIITNPIPTWKKCVDGTIDELIIKDFLK